MLPLSTEYPLCTNHVKQHKGYKSTIHKETFYWIIIDLLKVVIHQYMEIFVCFTFVLDKNMDNGWMCLTLTQIQDVFSRAQKKRLEARGETVSQAPANVNEQTNKKIPPLLQLQSAHHPCSGATSLLYQACSHRIISLQLLFSVI